MPASTLMMIGKKAPMKVRKVMVASLVGQNRMESGSQASGGIGRSSSRTGKVVSLSFAEIPIASPSATARMAATAKPANTRCALPAQLSQYAGSETSRGSPAATSPGPGKTSHPIRRANAHTAKKPTMPARPCQKAGFANHAGCHARAGILTLFAARRGGFQTRPYAPTSERCGDAAALPHCHPPAGDADHHARDIAQRAEHDHADDDIGQRDLGVTVEDQITQAGFAGDQLASDQREPSDTHRNLEPGEDRRQCAGDNDAPQHLPAPITEARGCTKIHFIDRAHAKIRVEQGRKQ